MDFAAGGGAAVAGAVRRAGGLALHLSQPALILKDFMEYHAVIAGHAWRTFWVTMAGFGIAIVVGVLLGFLIGSFCAWPMRRSTR